MTDNEGIRDIKKEVTEIRRETKELRVVTDNLFEHFEDLTRKVDKLEKNQEEMAANMAENQKKVMTHLDFIVGRLQKQEEEEASGTILIRQHENRLSGSEKQIADHESRIRELETAAA